MRVLIQSVIGPTKGQYNIKGRVVEVAASGRSAVVDCEGRMLRRNRRYIKVDPEFIDNIYTEEANISVSKLESASILKGSINHTPKAQAKKSVTFKLPCMHQNLNAGKDPECSGWVTHPTSDGGCCCTSMKTHHPGEKEPVTHEPCQDAPVAEIVSDMEGIREPCQDAPITGIVSAMANLAISRQPTEAVPRLILPS